MADSPVIRAESEFDPERCQAVNAVGQCHNKAIPGGTFCMVHGGNKQLAKQQNESKRVYMLTKWRAKLEEFGDSPNIKSLRDEIGILRIMMEGHLESCQNATDLMLQSGPISDLVLKIEKLVVSCHKLESSMGQYLDKQQLLQFTSEVIRIITDELAGNEDAVDRISKRILESFARAGEKDADQL